jgi:hypothetical protein
MLYTPAFHGRADVLQVVERVRMDRHGFRARSADGVNYSHEPIIERRMALRKYFSWQSCGPPPSC